VLVAGNFVFSAANPKAVIAQLKQIGWQTGISGKVFDFSIQTFSYE
jgi:hypothetical protein